MASVTGSRPCFVCFSAVLILLAAFYAGPLRAQVVGGTISGTVADNSGAVVANATVSLENLSTGVTTAVTTNNQGFYSIPNLLPGTYRQKVSAKGFETAIRNGIILTVGSQMVSNVTMKVGAISETVEVSDQPPDLQLETSAISSSTDSHE